MSRIPAAGAGAARRRRCPGSIGQLIEASALGTHAAREARLSARYVELTGMPEEQAEWDEEGEQT